MKNDGIQAVPTSRVPADHRRICWGTRRRIEVSRRQAIEVDGRVRDGGGPAAGDVVVAEGGPDGALDIDAERTGISDDVAADIDRLRAENAGARHLAGQGGGPNGFVDAAVEVIAGELQSAVERADAAVVGIDATVADRRRAAAAGRRAGEAVGQQSDRRIQGDDAVGKRRADRAVRDDQPELRAVGRRRHDGQGRSSCGRCRDRAVRDCDGHRRIADVCVVDGGVGTGPNKLDAAPIASRQGQRRRAHLHEDGATRVDARSRIAQAGEGL